MYAKISSLVKKVKAKAQENEAMPCEILKFYVLQMPASEKWSKLPKNDTGT